MKRKYGRFTAAVLFFLMLFSLTAVQAFAQEVSVAPAETYVNISSQSEETEALAEPAKVTVNIKDSNSGELLAQSVIELKFKSGTVSVNLNEDVKNYELKSLTSDSPFFAAVQGNTVSYKRPEPLPEAISLDVNLSSKTTKTISLSYDPNANGEAVTELPGAVSKEANQDGKAVFEISNAVPKRSGYEFLGWSLNAAATDPEFKIGAAGTPVSIELSDNAVLFAIWKANDPEPPAPPTPPAPPEPTEPPAPEVVWHGLSYDLNGGEGTINPDYQPYGGEFTVNGIIPTREGYTFVKWVTDLNNQEQNIKPGDKIKVTGDVVLHAVWKEKEMKTYTVNYSADGGKNAPASQSVKSNTGSAKIKLSDKMPKRDKMAFLGWALNKNGEVVLQPGQVAVLNDNYPEITLHAVWENRSANPKTGDSSGLFLWMSMAGLSLAGLALAAGVLKKKEN